MDQRYGSTWNGNTPGVMRNLLAGVAAGVAGATETFDLLRER